MVAIARKTPSKFSQAMGGIARQLNFQQEQQGVQGRFEQKQAGLQDRFDTTLMDKKQSATMKAMEQVYSYPIGHAGRDFYFGQGLVRGYWTKDDYETMRNHAQIVPAKDIDRLNGPMSPADQRANIKARTSESATKADAANAALDAYRMKQIPEPQGPGLLKRAISGLASASVPGSALRIARHIRGTPEAEPEEQGEEWINITPEMDSALKVGESYRAPKSKWDAFSQPRDTAAMHRVLQGVGLGDVYSQTKRLPRWVIDNLPAAWEGWRDQLGKNKSEFLKQVIEEARANMTVSKIATLTEKDFIAFLPTAKDRAKYRRDRDKVATREKITQQLASE